MRIFRCATRLTRGERTPVRFGYRCGCSPGKSNEERQNDHELVLGGEGGATVGAEAEGIACRLFVFASAGAALNFGLSLPFVFDDPLGLIVARDAAGQRSAAPGTEAIGLEFTFWKRTSLAASPWAHCKVVAHASRTTGFQRKEPHCFRSRAVSFFFNLR